MASIEIQTLANCYAEGKISKQAFRSLYSALALENFPKAEDKKPSVFRRFFKQLYYYLLISVVLLVVYFILSFVYPALFSQDNSYTYIDLPDNIQKAARTLATTPDWHPVNIEEFMQQWNDLSSDKQRAYKKSDWYRAFSLAATLQHTQQKMKMQDGKDEAMESLKALDKLTENQKMYAGIGKHPIKKKT